MNKLINTLMTLIVVLSTYICITSLNVVDAIPLAQNSHLIRLAGK